MRSRSSEATPRSTANCRRASITPAQSTDFGQRVEQVMQDTHFQIASLRKARSSRPNCTSRTNWLRQQVHVLGHGAAGRTLAALVAIVDAGFGQAIDLSGVGSS